MCSGELFVWVCMCVCILLPALSVFQLVIAHFCCFCCFCCILQVFDVCVNLPLAAAASGALPLFFRAICIYILFLFRDLQLLSFPNSHSRLGALAFATTPTHSRCWHTSLAQSTPLSPFVLPVWAEHRNCAGTGKEQPLTAQLSESLERQRTTWALRVVWRCTAGCLDDSSAALSRIRQALHGQPEKVPRTLRYPPCRREVCSCVGHSII